jgi:hypothetical protein
MKTMKTMNRMKSEKKEPKSPFDERARAVRPATRFREIGSPTTRNRPGPPGPNLPTAQS